MRLCRRPPAPDDVCEHGALPVVGLDLTDLDATGAPEPLAGVMLDLCCSAARLVQSPTESLRAVFALQYLEDWCATGGGDGEELPELGVLVRHMLRLLQVAGSVVDEARAVAS